jgi:hypothetical protein
VFPVSRHRSEAADEPPRGEPSVSYQASSFAGERSDVAMDREAAPVKPIAFSGRYLEGGELGRGGMGRVRAGYDAVLARTLALKRAKDGSSEAEARLLAEARITASLDHPGIITVLDAGRGADGGLYYVMRVVEGVSVGDLVKSVRSRTENVRLMLSVAQAMAYAHERGVVHRDLSPSNIRVGRHGEVVVMDWGLATSLEDAARGGVRCGTPGFTAPELREGAPSGPPADVFGLGVLLHLLLVGRLPEELRRPSGCPAELWAIVTRCLKVAPAERYPTASPLEQDLRAWLDGEKVSAYADRPWTPLARLARRQPSGVAVASVAALLLALVTTTLGVGATRAWREAEAATSLLLQQTAERATLEDDVAAARGAATALATHRPASPVAAGVLAAFRRATGVTSEPMVVEPGCDLLDARAGATVCRSQGVEHARLLGSGARVVFAPGADGKPGVTVRSASGAVVSSAQLEGGLQTIEASPDGRFLVATFVSTVAFIDDQRVTVVEVCAASTPGRFAIPGPSMGHATVLCGDTAWAVTPAGAVQRSSALPKGVFRGAALDEHRFVTGTVNGQLAVVEREGGRVLRVATSVVGPVRDVVALDDVVVAVRGRDGLGFWRADLDAWLLLEKREVGELRRMAGGVVTRGPEGWRSWKATAPSWHRARFETGLTSVAVSPTGDSVALGGADSVVRVVELGSGVVREVTREQAGVISHVAYSPAGRLLAFGTAGPFGVDVVDVERLQRLEGSWRSEMLRARFVDFPDDDTLVIVDYGMIVRRFSLSTGQPAGPQQQLPSVNLADLAFDRPRDRLLALMKDGALVEVGAAAMKTLGRFPEAQALAVDDASGAIVVAARTHVERRSPDAATALERHDVPGAAITGLALSPQGQWAAARIDGRVDVGTFRGVTQTVFAHQTRAAAVAFAANRLVTVGWDGVARVLEFPARTEE